MIETRKKAYTNSFFMLTFYYYFQGSQIRNEPIYDVY